MAGAVHEPGVGAACPVCRARFRGSRDCPRCGTDLTPLMRLVAGAYRLRLAAADALRSGDPLRARALAAQALAAHATPRARRLLTLATILTAAQPAA